MRGILNKAEAFHLPIWVSRKFDEPELACSLKNTCHIFNSNLFRKAFNVDGSSIHFLEVDVGGVEWNPAFELGPAF
jgi:hypothetical protein